MLFPLGQVGFFPPQNYVKGGSLYFFLLSDIIFAEATLFLQFFYMIYIAVCLPFKEEDPLAKVGSEAWQNVKKLII